jgi:hypothetical protein
MKPSGTPAPAAAPEPGIDKEGTGLPAFRSWRAVYCFVFAAFVLWVVLLAALTKAFS